MASDSTGRTTYLKRDLLQRGWTEGLIKRFLGGPDYTRNRYEGGYYCLFDIARVKKAEANPLWRTAVTQLKNRKEHPPKTVDLLAAIFAATRSAKRYRDMAQICYRRRKHGFAGQARWQKEWLYTLKDRGIAAAFLAGRIAPVRLVGDGLIEYRGEGYCYHSTLRPNEVEVPVAAADQPLLVEAKPREAKEPRLKDAVHTLKALPEVPSSFVRLVPEWQKRQQEERGKKQIDYEQKREQRSRNDDDDDVCPDCEKPFGFCQCD